MRRWAAPAPFLLSVAIHAVLLGAVVSASAPVRRLETVDVQMLETTRPPAPAARPEPPPEPARPPPPIRKVALAPPPQAPPAREPQAAPPPPNAPPPPSGGPPRQAPVRIGISMSSTSEAGAIPVPVGNSLYGRPPNDAPDPQSVQAYRADHYAPPSEVTALPEPLFTQVPKSEYPEEAKRIGFEGVVRVRLLVDEEGGVRRASIIDDAGHGLGPAAARIAERYFRFRPARRGGEAVATEIPFTIRFELP